MDKLQLLTDLHKGALRQGPGGDEETERAIELAGIDRDAPLNIADIGCGTGASTLVLARLANVRITAVDLLQGFLDILQSRAQNAGVAEKITAVCASMDNLPFAEETFDVIWCEGAIYNVGFRKGAADWQRFLKPGGVLVVSEISWTSNTRPAEIHEHWSREYPEIDVASAKIRALEELGYAPAGYLVLPEYCWLDNYYEPMRATFDDFLKRNGNTEAARAVVEENRHEIKLYENFKAYYGYGVYIARRRPRLPL